MVMYPVIKIAFEGPVQCKKCIDLIDLMVKLYFDIPSHCKGWEGTRSQEIMHYMDKISNSVISLYHTTFVT